MKRMWGLRRRMSFTARRGVLVTIGFLALLNAGAAAPAREDMSDDPKVERRLLTLADGFDLQLVAAEPTVINPVQIQFDPQGRLWVLCIPRYPQLLPGQDPRDYVVVLEDFDATGRARKSTVFAQGLTIPTGMAPGDGGVYVGQADKLLHFADTKGEGKADTRRVLLAGFGTQDTHHTLNSFRWGPDGSLYFNQGVYIKSTVETPYGPRRLWSGGIWQLRPGSLRLEIYDRSIQGTNTWGHVFDSWGQSFCTTAWPKGVYLVLPETPLNAALGDASAGTVPPLALTRVADGRHCGATFISGRHFPDAWQGNLISGNFASQQVQRFELRDTGGRFAGKELPPLVVSRHRKFRPVDVQMGPDGALYVADWYDQVIQHNQIDFRDPRRDHSRGRIWRIVARKRPLLTPPRLTGVPVAAVLEQLKAPEQWTRQQAKRALAGRDAGEVAGRLGDWVRRLEANDPDLPRHLLEALWTCQTIDRVDAGLLARVLRAPEPRARAAAARVVGAWQDRLEDPLGLLAPLAIDPHPRVRLEAVLAATHVPSARAFEIALAALDQPGDPLVDFALRKASVVLRPYWYPEFQKGRLTFAGRPGQLAFALQAVQGADAVPALAQLVRTGQVPAASLPSVLGRIAEHGDARALALVWEQVCAAGRLPAAERVRLLGVLGQSARQRKVLPAGDLDRLADLIGQPDLSLSAAALRLAGAWRQEQWRAELNRRATDDDPGRRQAAVQALVELGGPASAQRLETLAAAGKPYPVRVQAVIGLSALDLKRAAAAAAQLLRQPTAAGEDPAAVYVAFVQRAGGAPALADALQAARPSADAAKVGLRVLNTMGTPAASLSRVLQESAGVAGAARPVTPEEVRRLLALVRTQGDARRGEVVFRRRALACQQCHALAGAGGQVGPDLSAIGASSQLDYLLESILLPSKVIREGYNTAQVVTTDGKLLSGIVVRENKQELVLRNLTEGEVVIPTRLIEERSGSGRSLMPDGLKQLLTDAELADLVCFLSALGKPGPFAVSHVPLARRWKYLASLPETLAAQDPAALGKALRENTRLAWATAFSTIAGDLPLAEVRPGPESSHAVVRCELDVVNPGRLTLGLNDAHGVQAWLDGRPVAAGDRIPVELGRGIHTLDLRVDLRERRDGVLRCALLETRGSTAQARFVGGR